MSKTQTLHPDPGKQGTRIDSAKYDAVRNAILEHVGHDQEGIRFGELVRAMKDTFKEGLPGGGSVGWYTTTVKLDLEARGEIQRVVGESPQRLVLGPSAG